nr:precorrin-8X methylmutase [Veillonella denticariosi]
MVRTGISKPALKLRGNEVHCLIKDENVAKMAKELGGVTRSIAAMRTFGKQLEGQIVAIGNAPTALYEVLRLALEEGVKPALIIGIPVGFVGGGRIQRLPHGGVPCTVYHSKRQQGRQSDCRIRM